MSYTTEQIRVTATGSAGSATGTADSKPLYGRLVSVTIDYHASAPNTTTVALAETGVPGRTLLSKSGSNTDVTHYPRVQMQDTSGSAITGVYEPFALNGSKVRVTVAASNAMTDVVVVTLILEVL